MNVNKLFLVLKIDLPHLECFHSFIFVSEVNLFWRPGKKSVYIHSTLYTCSTFSCIAGSYNINSKSPACCTCARCNHILASILFAWRKDYVIKSSTRLKKSSVFVNFFFTITSESTSGIPSFFFLIDNVVKLLLEKCNHSVRKWIPAISPYLKWPQHK